MNERAEKELAEERNASQCQTDDHAWSREEHDLPSANDVDILECEQRKDKVRAGNDESDCCGLVESDFFEEGGAVIHKDVETGELLLCLKTTTND